jgi:hypothetical protein
MRIRGLLGGREYRATVTTESSASSYGQAAVLVDGEAIDPIGIEIIELSDAGFEALPLHWLAALPEGDA